LVPSNLGPQQLQRRQGLQLVRRRLLPLLLKLLLGMFQVLPFYLQRFGLLHELLQELGLL
jgi:cell division protein FtsB